MFKQGLGFTAVHIPYRGANPAQLALLAREVDFNIDNLAAASANIKSGKLKALAVTTAAESPPLPGVPALSKSIPGFAIDTWWGLVAPAGTPADVIDKLNKAFTEALKDPETQKRFATLMAEPGPTTAKQFGDFMAAERAKYEPVVKASGAERRLTPSPAQRTEGTCGCLFCARVLGEAAQAPAAHCGARPCANTSTSASSVHRVAPNPSTPAASTTRSRHRPCMPGVQPTHGRGRSTAATPPGGEDHAQNTPQLPIAHSAVRHQTRHLAPLGGQRLHQPGATAPADPGRHGLEPAPRLPVRDRRPTLRPAQPRLARRPDHGRPPLQPGPAAAGPGLAHALRSTTWPTNGCTASSWKPAPRCQAPKR